MIKFRTEKFRQILFLILLSVLGFMVLEEITRTFLVNGWVIPATQETVLPRGLVSNMLLALLTAAFLILMAWLPRQLSGGISVTLALGSIIFLFELASLIGIFLRVHDGEQPDPMLWLDYRVREFLVIGVLPLVVIDVARRSLSR